MAFDSPATRQGEARRDEIIAQAIDVFGEAGFAGARIDDVAERVGIRRPSILYHYSDKPALYAAAISDVVGDIANRIEDAMGSPQERLDAIADAWVDFVIDRPNAARLLLRQMIDANPASIPGAEAPIRRLVHAIETAIEEATDSVSAKSLEASEFSLVLASTSLVWVASRSAVEGALGIDTLSPTAVQRHRNMLHALIRQLIAARRDAQSERIETAEDASITHHKG